MPYTHFGDILNKAATAARPLMRDISTCQNHIKGIEARDLYLSPLIVTLQVSHKNKPNRNLFTCWARGSRELFKLSGVQLTIVYEIKPLVS